MTEITQMISAVGFPIVFCLLMFWQGNKTIKENTQAIRELTKYIRR